MEKETYKVAKQILEKFAPAQLNRPTVGPGGGRGSNSLLNASLPVTSRSPLPRPGQPDLRQRRPGPGGPGPGAGGPASTSSQPSNLNQTIAVVPSGGSAASSAGGVQGSGPRPPMVLGGRGAQGPPLPRPVLPRERGYLDKFVEYLVGDGPSNRYALICKQCQSHNGMALREEFEYIAYRCCYCYYWNPARKQRPVAPRLPDPGQVRTEESDSSRSSSASGSRSSSRTRSGVALVEGVRGGLGEGMRQLEGSRRNSQSETEVGHEMNSAEEHTEEVVGVIHADDHVENFSEETEEDNLASDERVDQSEEVLEELPNPENGTVEEDLQNKVEQINEVVKSDGDFELVNAGEQITTEEDEAMEVDRTV